jgi:hypothetical protein
VHAPWIEVTEKSQDADSAGRLGTVHRALDEQRGSGVNASDEAQRDIGRQPGPRAADLEVPERTVAWLSVNRANPHWPLSRDLARLVVVGPPYP